MSSRFGSAAAVSTARARCDWGKPQLFPTSLAAHCCRRLHLRQYRATRRQRENVEQLLRQQRTQCGNVCCGETWRVLWQRFRHSILFGLETSVLLPLRSHAAIHARQPFSGRRRRAGEVPEPRVLVTTPSLRALLRDTPRLPVSEADRECDRTVGTAARRIAERRYCTRVIELFGSIETCVIAHRAPHGIALAGLSGSRLATAARRHTGRSEPFCSARAIEQIAELSPGRQFILRGRNADLLEIGGKRASLGELTRRLLRSRVEVVWSSSSMPTVMASPARRARGSAHIEGSADTRCPAAVDRPGFLPRPLRRVAHRHATLRENCRAALLEALLGSEVRTLSPVSELLPFIQFAITTGCTTPGLGPDICFMMSWCPVAGVVDVEFYGPFFETTFITEQQSRGACGIPRSYPSCSAARLSPATPQPRPRPTGGGPDWLRDAARFSQAPRRFLRVLRDVVALDAESSMPGSFKAGGAWTGGIVDFLVSLSCAATAAVMLNNSDRQQTGGFHGTPPASLKASIANARHAL